ncbi:hypothetical protein EJ04DRAFT_256081 [Polyplosphaeria fusca]|uniref:Uncharacterized protein n=1 Tax=Polyplosphaeria fusca TaxID=682080 RepID=A0A9P4V379_9PLEO|nr:hypothetical protein EJ04DRAFT_256081 [Polyplosphaeria fusca]
MTPRLVLLYRSIATTFGVAAKGRRAAFPPPADLSRSGWISKNPSNPSYTLAMRHFRDLRIGQERVDYRPAGLDKERQPAKFSQERALWNLLLLVYRDAPRGEMARPELLQRFWP